MRFLLLISFLLFLLSGCATSTPMEYSTTPLNRSSHPIHGFSSEKASTSINIISEILLKPLNLQFLGIALFEINEYVTASFIDPLNDLRRFQIGSYSGIVTLDASRDLKDVSLVIDIHF